MTTESQYTDFMFSFLRTLNSLKSERKFFFQIFSTDLIIILYHGRFRNDVLLAINATGSVIYIQCA